jgi:hypothetical protein
MTLLADPSAPASIDADGNALFTTGAVEIRAGANVVTEPDAQRIVIFLMMYGGWEAVDEVEVVDGKVVGLKFEADPEQANPGQDFEIIGSLSSMYSRLFELGSSGPTGITALDIEVEPGTLISLIPHDFKSPQLPIWRFVLSPSVLPEL